MIIRRLRSFLTLGGIGALISAGVATSALGQIVDGQQDETKTDSTSRSAASAQVSTAATQSSSARYRPDQVSDPASRTSDRARQADGDEAPPERARRAAMPSEFEAYVAQVADKKLTRFGANLLVPAARDFTVPPTATVPASYRLNPGDELIIGLTGSVNGDQLHRTIDADGRIFLPQVGSVDVAGVPYGNVEAVIAARVARQYRDVRIAVTIGKLHGITVYVTGFAATPGSYTVSSLSTVVNAVLAAGGPGAGGSFRSIEVRRQGRLISDFDLYDLLLKGDKRTDVVLENGDVIAIAAAGPQVGVIGSVNNEAIFETRGAETLADVLHDAGGINTVGDETRLLLLNPVETNGTGLGWQILSFAEARNRPAERGEVVRVVSNLGIARPLAQQPVFVTVSGEVAKPGRYFVPAGTSVGAILAQAGGLTANAYPYGTVFTRERMRQEQQRAFDRAVRDTNLLLTTEPVTQALLTGGIDSNRLVAIRDVVAQLEARKPEGRLVLGIDPEATTVPGDVVLENNDGVYVPPRPVVVGVFGSVPSPSSFQYHPGVKLANYLQQAGGVQRIGDRGQVFIVRANGTVLAPRHGLFAGTILNESALPGDLIYVPIDASRGEFFTKLRLLISGIFNGLFVAAPVANATR